MRSGISVPCFGDAAAIVEMGRSAEEAGWDGFFVWDHVLYRAEPSIPIVDPWIVLSAVGATTERIIVGPLVTPLARRRPWKVARETVSLDHITGGRTVLGVGLGWPSRDDFGLFGDSDDERVRGEQLDEALDVVTGLWSGEPFAYRGAHFTVSEVRFLPPPLQQPRIPIWVGGMWPHRRPFERAARWDGAVPLRAVGDRLRMMTPDEIDQLMHVVRERRAPGAHFDVVLGGQPPEDAGEWSDVAAAYAEAGATWWLESTDGLPGWEVDLLDRLHRGPPA
jgi:alkanesulfonate monooxygenase SsuD/methylene tetrahydromethanopterin reductase-like flavin-dependent oxidoreductase (luciferase family)